MAKGVKLETAYVELVLDGSAIEGQLKDTLDKAGRTARDSGKKIGKEVSGGLKDSVKDIEGHLKDSWGRAVPQAREAGKRIGKEITDGVKDAAKDPVLRKTFDDMAKTAADEIGAQVGERIGKALGNSPIGDFVQNLRDKIAPAVESVGSLGDALAALHDHDAATALSDVANAVREIGGKDGTSGKAAEGLDNLGKIAGQYQSTYTDMKSDIDGIKTGLEALVVGMPAAEAALGGLASAASAALIPLAAFFGTVKLAEELTHHDPALPNGPTRTTSPFPVGPVNNNPPIVSAGPLTQPGTTGAPGSLGPFDALDPGRVPNTSASPRGLGGGPQLPAGVAGPPPGSQNVPAPIPGDGLHWENGKGWVVDPGWAGLPGMGPLLANSQPRTGGAAAPSGMTARGRDGGLNLSTIPIAAQRYANDCIDASARIILSHAGVNMDEDQLQRVIAPGGTITSQAAGLNQLNPGGGWVPMAGSGGSLQVMSAAIRASIDSGHGSILNVAPGSSIAGRPFPEGHFIAVTGYNPDGTLNLSDTAGGTQYSVSPADAFQATRGRGIVVGGGVPSFDKGTDGPLSEDTLAQLHKGEVVVPKDQVDAAMAGDQQQGEGLNRTEGFMPAAAAGNAGGVAGTSSLAGILNLGNQAVSGLIDTGASAAEMAISAAASAGSFGAGGQAAGPAAGIGIQLLATEGKRLSSFGFQALSILGDAAIEQAFPFGAPRWLGYDYTSFLPDLNISQIGTTTAEKAVQQAMGQGKDTMPGEAAPGTTGSPFAPLGPMTPDQMAGGPVNPSHLAGAQPTGAPVPKYGSTPPGAPPSGGPSPDTGPGGGGPGTPPPAADVAPPQIPNSMGDPSMMPNLGDIFAGVFDEGGTWPSGTIGVNTSGRDELVLSGHHLDQLAAKKPTTGSSGATYNIYATDTDDAMRRLKSKERLDAMRYTGRF